jgi:hypothetical protein
LHSDIILPAYFSNSIRWASGFFFMHSCIRYESVKLYHLFPISFISIPAEVNHTEYLYQVISV